MNKCIKILLKIELKDGFLHNVIQKYARKYELEGIAEKWSQDEVKIIVCGEKNAVDSFVDSIHKEAPKQNLYDIEIEPFLKDKDYRGVFRIIE